MSEDTKILCDNCYWLSKLEGRIAEEPITLKNCTYLGIYPDKTECECWKEYTGEVDTSITSCLRCINCIQEIQIPYKFYCLRNSGNEIKNFHHTTDCGVFNKEVEYTFLNTFSLIPDAST